MTGISHKAAGLLGWSRVDAKPWTANYKGFAEWQGPQGWTLSHCGHPTANYPWILRDHTGKMITTGAVDGLPDQGRCWPNLRMAMEYVASLPPAEAGA